MQIFFFRDTGKKKKKAGLDLTEGQTRLLAGFRYAAGGTGDLDSEAPGPRAAGQLATGRKAGEGRALPRRWHLGLCGRAREHASSRGHRLFFTEPLLCGRERSGPPVISRD